MLIFFDETFRTSQRAPDVTLGALCGVGIREHQLASVAQDVYLLKLKHMGADYARNHEIKGKDLLKNYVFRLAAQGVASKNLALASDLIDYIVGKALPVFGCVCFEKGMQKFQVDDVSVLDHSFRFLFERIDVYMKRVHPKDMACLVFDDRDYGINQKNSEAITNFFQRSAWGLSMDSVVRTPFFAISQSQNIGLQLADFVTTLIGLRFSSSKEVQPYFEKLKKAIPSWQSTRGPHRVSGLKVMRDKPAEKEKAPGGLSARGRDKKAQHPALGRK